VTAKPATLYSLATPRREGAWSAPGRRQGGLAGTQHALTQGSIKVDALGTEEVQRKKIVPEMVFTFPLETIALLMTNLGQWRTSKKFCDTIIRCVVVEFRTAFLMKGVRVTDVQVDVPAAMCSEHKRATAEPHLMTLLSATTRRGWKPGDSSTGRGLECTWTSARESCWNAWRGNHACSRGGSGWTSRG
jgi:hypothetical protein